MNAATALEPSSATAPFAATAPALTTVADDHRHAAALDDERESTPEQAEDVGDDELLAALFVFVAQQLEAGRSPSEIKAELVQAGADPELAAALTDAHRDAYREQQTTSGDGGAKMVMGGLWMAGGLAATLLSFGAGGDTTVVFWGAVAYGGTQFLRGMADL